MSFNQLNDYVIEVVLSVTNLEYLIKIVFHENEETWLAFLKAYICNDKRFIGTTTDSFERKYMFFI